MHEAQQPIRLRLEARGCGIHSCGSCRFSSAGSIEGALALGLTDGPPKEVAGDGAVVA
jgi:hypothetical protein